MAGVWEEKGNFAVKWHIRFVNMILQCGVLFAFLALGELVVMATGIPVPSSIIGMLLLAAGLKAGVVKLSQVEKMANFLVHNLGFFFVPAGIGLMSCFGIIRGGLLPIIGASVVSTVIIIVVTGRVHQWVRHLNVVRGRRGRVGHG